MLKLGQRLLAHPKGAAEPLSQFSGQLNDDACSVQIQDRAEKFENVAAELFDCGAIPLF
jgi:hypothetical protein